MSFIVELVDSGEWLFAQSMPAGRSARGKASDLLVGREAKVRLRVPHIVMKLALAIVPPIKTYAFGAFFADVRSVVLHPRKGN